MQDMRIILLLFLSSKYFLIHVHVDNCTSQLQNI